MHGVIPIVNTTYHHARTEKELKAIAYGMGVVAFQAKIKNPKDDNKLKGLVRIYGSPLEVTLRESWEDGWEMEKEAI